MGLPTLRDKIERKFRAAKCSEEDVLYVLIEVAKYLERSLDSKDLRDPPNLKVNPKNFPTVVFFRNWVAHTEKDRGEIPERTARALLAAARGFEVGDHAFFEPLITELVTFAQDIGVDIEVRWDEFIYRLKCILAEQPVTLKETNIRVGYNDALALRAF